MSRCISFLSLHLPFSWPRLANNFLVYICHNRSPTNSLCLPYLTLQTMFFLIPSPPAPFPSPPIPPSLFIATFLHEAPLSLGLCRTPRLRSSLAPVTTLQTSWRPSLLRQASIYILPKSLPPFGEKDFRCNPIFKPTWPLPYNPTCSHLVCRNSTSLTQCGVCLSEPAQTWKGLEQAPTRDKHSSEVMRSRCCCYYCS